MFFQGGDGDINPFYAVHPLDQDAVRMRDWTGERLGKEAVRVAKNIRTESTPAARLDVAEDVLDFHVRWNRDAFVGAVRRSSGDDNAAVVEGPLNAGCAKHAPYNALYLDGAVEQVPPALVSQLADGGRMVGVLLDRGVGRATLWIKSGNAISHRVLFDANVTPLPGFAAPARFVF